MAKLADQVKDMKWRDPSTGEELEMGSLISKGQVDRVAGLVDRARDKAEVVVGGNRGAQGATYYEPSVIGGD